LIVRLRFDILLGDYDLFDELSDSVVVPILCDNVWATTKAAVSDLLAFGPSDLMHEYFAVFPNIQKLCEDGCILYGEGLLGSHLLAANVPVKRRFIWFASATHPLLTKADLPFFERVGPFDGVVLRDDPNLDWSGGWYGVYKYYGDAFTY